MPSFRTHSFFGVSFGGALAFLAVAQGFTSAARGLLAAVIFALASVLPDVDSDTGTPRRFLLETVSLLIAAACVRQFAPDTAEQGFLLIIVIYFGIRWPCEFLLQRFTVHHGIFHSIPMALVFAAGVMLVFHRSPENFRYFYAAAGAAGWLLHLTIDEIHAFFSGSGKFGSSLKFYSSSFSATLLTYLAAALLLAAAFFPEWREYIF